MSGEEIVHVEGVLRVCCANPENLVEHRQSSDLVVRICRECDRKHYELSVDPAHLGIRIS